MCVCVCVCVCVQSESSLLKDRRSSSAGLTAASSDTVLLRDVASLKERKSNRYYFSFYVTKFLCFYIFLTPKTFILWIKK